MEKHVISKSSFLRALQCSKSLYLYKNHPDQRDQISKEQQAVFNRGHNVGYLAREMFSPGVDCRTDKPFQYSASIRKTENLIAQGVEILFEAAFQYKRVLALVDVLTGKNGKWKAWEVKSSTKVNKVHIFDAALQYFVLNNSGIELEDFFMIHLSSQYKRDQKINTKELFTAKSVFNEILDLQPYIRDQIQKSKETLQRTHLPSVPIGAHCFSPYLCDFMGYCWKDVPDNSVFDLAFLDRNEKFKLYDEGYRKLSSLPDDLPLNAKSKTQVRSFQKQEAIIDIPKLSGFLKNLSYPLHFLDFEAFMPAIPLFAGTRPYQFIPFQYSLHYKEHPGKKTLHHEFLAQPGTDPRELFLTGLLKDTRTSGKIVVFDKNFEKQVLQKLIKDFPSYKKKIEDLISRLVDLRIPFHHQYYYHPAMKGNYSLKSIVSAIRPELNYDNFTITNGGIASVIFERLQEEKDPGKIHRMKNQLREYCKQDTLALVRLLEFLKSRVLTHSPPS